VCSYLEQRVPGLKFLSHYDVPEAMGEEDDEELLFLMRQLSVHPDCEARSEEDTAIMGHLQVCKKFDL
tara:strand:- start:104 stop:307 length:204 start_codon:yes stop_codon:yes gene_type:complete